MGKIIIVGNGPAGISASLYAKRAGMDVTVIGMGYGGLEKAESIANYYGLGKPMSGKELHENGLNQARDLGIEIINDQVVSLGFNEKLEVITENEVYPGDAVILATGSSRRAPNVKGLKDFEGKGVSYCAVCDGFFHRGKDVAVLGSGEYALHEAKELLPIANSVTILTNGEEPSVEIPEEIKVNTQKIEEISGEMLLNSVVFEDGSKIEVTGLFIAIGVAGSDALARKIGAMTEGNKIVVDEKMATNIPGLYAAGDCTPGMLQVAKAVYQGAEAATSAIKYIRANG